jgi:uncharacterized protein YkwD
MILTELRLAIPCIGYMVLGLVGIELIVPCSAAMAIPPLTVLTEALPAESHAIRLTQTPTPGAAETDFLQELLELVNDERAAVGAAPVTLSPQLTEAAQRHAEDMANNTFLSHFGSDGSTMQTRIEAADYNWSAIGENIAMGQTSPEAVMESWMDSSGHRQNILNPNYSELGLGYAEAANGPYWVQVFAKAR